ncbi:3-oxoacyl-ACP synthase [Streptomyces sp. ISL-12]|uniref:3-oxoacyl-[acyl-carrier-protein] synthase III C-terminal domain-containing protein n=1 Tax=Streptomyces sp. ISL-12 TaxID=2819177 RepID=UPI001BEA2C9B|nr:3-oxoacyl-[acyl-carrier-protein] synthase III C-terminal domain-containing protein [Streptomyces sp. ISL-12]MBT2413699.1 3-oxoacyl-ACP synthase [Streptomyces sp. ISL-12]
MRWDDIHIKATGAWLPETTVTAEEAVRTGQYSRDEADRSRQSCLVVAAEDDRVPDFAVRAARRALDRAGTAPDELAAVLHGVLMHNGIDVWNSTSYVQRELGAVNAFGSEVRAGSNGGLAALELGAALLRARPDSGPVLITCADAWRAPYFDRWRADSGLVFGDGGSALVASRDEEGFARLVSMVTTQDPELEGLHRGDEEFGPFRHSAHRPIDLYRRAQEFLARTPKDEVWERGAIGLRAAVEQATEEAGTSVKEADHVVLPHFGAHLLVRQCLEPLGLTGFDRTDWEFARRVGHLGAGDQIAGLDHLAASGVLAPGQKVVLLGVGGGFNWTCAVLEVLRTPDWTD